MTELTARGQSGTVAFDGQMVTISHEGVLARMTHGKGEKRIPLRSISAVQWKDPAILTNGFIQFTLAGGVERNVQKGSRTMSAVDDENSVVFTSKQRDAMYAVKVAIEDAMAGGTSAPTPQPPATQGPPAGWYQDQHDASLNRWWDGAMWTEHTQPR